MNGMRKQHLLEALPEVFSNQRPREEKAGDDMAAELYQLKKISVIYS